MMMRLVHLDTDLSLMLKRSEVMVFKSVRVILCVSRQIKGSVKRKPIHCNMRIKAEAVSVVLGYSLPDHLTQLIHILKQHVVVSHGPTETGSLSPGKSVRKRGCGWE